MGHIAGIGEVDGLGAPGGIPPGPRLVPTPVPSGRRSTTSFRSNGLDKPIAAHILRRERHDE